MCRAVIDLAYTIFVEVQQACLGKLEEIARYLEKKYPDKVGLISSIKSELESRLRELLVDPYTKLNEYIEIVKSAVREIPELREVLPSGELADGLLKLKGPKLRSTGKCTRMLSGA